MKIYKIANMQRTAAHGEVNAGEDVPQGFIFIDTVIDVAEGTQEKKIVRGNSSKCNDVDKSILDKMFGTKIPGFGVPQVDAGGHTTEYHEQNKVTVDQGVAQTTPQKPIQQKPMKPMQFNAPKQRPMEGTMGA